MTSVWERELEKVRWHRDPPVEWMKEVPSFRAFIEARESLDSIDLAYLELELPPGYDVEVIGPRFTSAPPFELARWADDGGRV